MGRIMTITGPTGSGKTVVTQELLRTRRHFVHLTGMTTRPMRPDNAEGENEIVTVDELKSNTLWNIGHGRHLYGLKRTKVVDILDARPEVTGVFLSLPKTVPILRDFVNDFCGDQHHHLAIFLVPPPDEVFRERMRVGRRDYEAVMIERRSSEDHWEEEARTSSIPYHFIPYGLSIEETAHEIIRRLG